MICAITLLLNYIDYNQFDILEYNFLGHFFFKLLAKFFDIKINKTKINDLVKQIPIFID